MVESVKKFANCPYCDCLLTMDVWKCRPEWLTMFVRVRCCDSYANVNWRDSKTK
jgi:hypothetical protein